MNSISRWFTERREEKIKESFYKHVNLVAKTTEQLGKLLNLWITKGEFSQAFYERVRNYEKDADNVRRELLIALAESSIEPDVKGYLARIVRRADYIADWGLESARILQVLEKYKFSHILGGVLKEIIAKVKNAVRKVEKAIQIMFIDLHETLNLCDEIERIEEDIDELYQEARIICIKECAEFPAVISILLLYLLDSLENIADTCENTSDSIREYIMRRA